MKTLPLPIAGALALSTAMATPAAAHHSFSAEFDINKPVTLRGTVTRMQFSNPHTWLHITVTTEDGEEQQWMVEGGAPNALVRRGWDRDSLPPGTEVVVNGYQARDAAFRATGVDVTLPDGTQLFVGSSGAGAPTR